MNLDIDLPARVQPRNDLGEQYDRVASMRYEVDWAAPVVDERVEQMGRELQLPQVGLLCVAVAPAPEGLGDKEGRGAPTAPVADGPPQFGRVDRRTVDDRDQTLEPVALDRDRRVGRTDGCMSPEQVGVLVE